MPSAYSSRSLEKIFRAFLRASGRTLRISEGGFAFRIDGHAESVSTARDIGVAVALRSHVYTCTRNHRAAVLYTARVHLSAGIKPRYDLLASARGPASICHGDATHRYRLARPRNYPRRARILQRTPVIYRRGSPSRHTPPRTRGVSPSLPLSCLTCHSLIFFWSIARVFPRDDRVNFHASSFIPLLSFPLSGSSQRGAVTTSLFAFPRVEFFLHDYDFCSS